MANYVNLAYGTLSAFQALGSKDSNTLYFVDGVIYKGATPYSTTVTRVSADPTSPAQGVLYLYPDYSMKMYNGTSLETVAVGMVTSIGDDTTNDSMTVSQGAIKAYVTAQLAAFDDSSTTASDIATAKSEAISESKTYTDEQITAKIASVFRFKGAKDTYAEVTALTDMVTGDVWHVNADGKEYVYTGSAWELLGFTVDLSSYATTEAVTAAINAKAAEIIASLEEHTGNSDIHVTAAQKTAWDAKATAEDVATAKSEAISSATSTAAADATSKANQALSDAKEYADGLNTAMDTRVTAVETALTWQTL